MYVCDSEHRRVYRVDVVRYPKALDKCPDSFSDNVIRESLESGVRDWNRFATYEDIKIRAKDGELHNEPCLVCEEPYDVKQAQTLGGIEESMNEAWPGMEARLKERLKQYDDEDEPWKIAFEELPPGDYELPEWRPV